MLPLGCMNHSHSQHNALSCAVSCHCRVHTWHYSLDCVAWSTPLKCMAAWALSAKTSQSMSLHSQASTTVKHPCTGPSTLPTIQNTQQPPSLTSNCLASKQQPPTAAHHNTTKLLIPAARVQEAFFAFAAASCCAAASGSSCQSHSLRTSPRIAAWPNTASRIAGTMYNSAGCAALK